MGGPSAEHDVSLDSGEQIIAHLDPMQYTVTPVTIAKTGEWIMPDTKEDQTNTVRNRKLSPADALVRMAETIHVAFIALHGTFGEDGTIQGLLESFNIPYTGSGILASALGMDKPRSLAVFRDSRFNVPAFRVVHRNEYNQHSKKLLHEVSKEFSFPLVVKPSNLGSSVGVNIIHTKPALSKGIRHAFTFAPNIIIQKFVSGREITCGVLEKSNGSLIALPPVEIIPRKNKFYDYKSKYSNHGSDHFIPPPHMTPKTISMIQHAAYRAHQIIGCSGMSRTDFILGNDGTLSLLEINTIPGMTKTSLLPQSAAAAGISFPRLIDMLVQSALTIR